MNVRHAAQVVIIRIQAFGWFLLDPLNFGLSRAGKIAPTTAAAT
jgi:hypothetical protein